MHRRKLRTVPPFIKGYRAQLSCSKVYGSERLVELH